MEEWIKRLKEKFVQLKLIFTMFWTNDNYTKLKLASQVTVAVLVFALVLVGTEQNVLAAELARCLERGWFDEDTEKDKSKLRELLS